ncbi:MAG: hypothetical protein H6738_21175 [Alphaproteobacteria bacterium]|nr:hypothetical protein [Alphaproteobacteria bacterium]MCB9699307.1 hypothetical protein [Alphaproteobacteria bacterium]
MSEGTSASRTALEAALRQLVYTRAVSTTAVLLGAALPLVERTGPGLVLVAVAGITELLCALTLSRHLAAMRAGDRGELLLQLGPRVPLDVLRAHQRAERLESGMFAVISVVAVLLLTPTRGMALVGVVLEVGLVALMLVLATARAHLRALNEAVAALCAMDAESAERWLVRLESARAPVWRRMAKAHRQTLRLWSGDVAGTHAQMEADWSGTMDHDAANVALARLGTRGDTDLARRWLEAAPADNRFQRWQRATVGGQLALVEHRWDDAVALTSDPQTRDVPPYFLRQLDLIRAAALRGAGRGAEADVLIATLDPPLDREAWRALAFPAMWALLGGRAAPPVPPRAPAPVASTPFAPPETVADGARPISSWRGIGAIPVEHVLIAGSRYGQVLDHAGTAVLLGLAPMLVLSGTLLALTGTLALGLVNVVLGLYLVLMGGIRAAASLLPRRPDDRTVVLGDGRQIPGSRWVWFALRVTSPFLNVIALVSGLMPLTEGLSSGWWTGLFIGLPLVALYGWAGRRRWRLLRGVGAVHFLPPAEARADAEARWAADRAGRNAARIWLALARLWTGDVAGAEQVAREEKELDVNAAFLLRWLQAGRGEADLERLLAAPDPERLGDRYRAAITVALAALQAERADRVVARCEDWEALAERIPNRYGALLARLSAQVRRACGQRVDLPDDPDLAWVATVWPFAA